MPDRAVQSLDEAYLYATEVNLATLEELCMLGSTSRARIRRQKTICAGMLEICRSSLVSKDPKIWGSPLKYYSRVSKLMDGGPEALEQHVASFNQYRK